MDGNAAGKVDVERLHIERSDLTTRQSRDMVQPTENTRLSWREALTRQGWANIIAHLLVIIPLVIIVDVAGDSPAATSFVLYDGTISSPYLGESTIPFWVVPFVPLISLLLSLLALETINVRRARATPTVAAATTIFWLLEFIFSQMMTALLTELFKVLVGRHRPDWLSRCNPQAPGEVQVEWGLPPSENPSCNSDLSESKLSDGQKSFPSGHSSSAFAGAVFVAGYVIFATAYHSPRQYANQPRRSFKTRMVAEIGSLLVFIWILFQVAWAWGVAVSRVTDNKHHPSDVVGGGMLGASIAGVYLARALPRHFMVADAPESIQQPLLPTSDHSRDAHDGGIPRSGP